MNRSRLVIVLLTTCACLLFLGACGGATDSRPVTSRRRSRESQSPRARVVGESKLRKAQLKERDIFDKTSLALYANLLTNMVRSRQYVDGVWHPTYSCFYCGISLGATAAIETHHKPSQFFRNLAIKTFDTALDRYELPTGAYGPPATGDEEETGTSTVALGIGYLEMANQVPSKIAVRWKHAILAADHYLAELDNFYVNGNVNLQLALALYIGWLVSGEKSLLDEYNTAYAFTLHPGPSWPGFGLHYSPVPTVSLGTNRAGYLGEKGAGAPGFDPHYTILQATYASTLYLLSGQRKVLRLANFLMNQLLTRINTKNLVINTGDGSRFPTPNVFGNFASADLPVLAFADRGSDLLKLVPKELALIISNFDSYVKVANDQDQVIGNYSYSLIGSQAPPPEASAASRGQHS